MQTTRRSAFPFSSSRISHERYILKNPLLFVSETLEYPDPGRRSAHKIIDIATPGETNVFDYYYDYNNFNLSDGQRCVVYFSKGESRKGQDMLRWNWVLHFGLDGTFKISSGVGCFAWHGRQLSCLRLPTSEISDRDLRRARKISIQRHLPRHVPVIGLPPQDFGKLQCRRKGRGD